jgi:hypothetical protein
LKKGFIILWLFASNVLSAQSGQQDKVIEKSVTCDFVFETDTTLKEKEYILSSYLTDGECDVYNSAIMRDKFATILKTKIPISEQYFLNQFKEICLLDKCVLQKVGVYRMSAPGEVMLIITYK